MRIIGGIYRSRKIVFPLSAEIRPTKDRIRESIFSALSDEIINRRVLDLFAGSGAYGLEALSRGAVSITFVDNNHLAIKSINENIKNLGVLAKCQVFTDDYQSYLAKTKNEYSLIFLDPPYILNIYLEVIKEILEKKIASSNAIIICETNHALDFSSLGQEFKIREYHYGDTIVYILRR